MQTKTGYGKEYYELVDVCEHYKLESKKHRVRSNDTTSNSSLMIKYRDQSIRPCAVLTFEKTVVNRKASTICKFIWEKKKTNCIL